MTDLLRRFRAYWDEKRGSLPMPRRRAIDPTEVPKLLPYMLLVEVIDGGEDFRIHLIGSAVRDQSDINNAGLLFSEIDPDRASSQIWRDYGRVMREGGPVEMPIAYVGPDGHARHARHLLLPLADDAGALRFVLTLVDYDARPAPSELPALAEAARSVSERAEARAAEGAARRRAGGRAARR